MNANQSSGELSKSICIGVFGSQSSGKSTILNYILGTKFQTMDRSIRRQQTTKGVWMACVDMDTGTPFDTINVFDIEGSDSVERAETANVRQIYFHICKKLTKKVTERRIGVFWLLTCDILMVNVKTEVSNLSTTTHSKGHWEVKCRAICAFEGYLQHGSFFA